MSDSGRMDESTLVAVVRRAQGGDAEALGEIYRHYYGRVLGLCRRLLRSPEAAEDAANETFLRAQRAIGSFNGTVSFATWLLSIASHHCLDQLRHRTVEQRLMEPEWPDWQEPEAPELTPLGQMMAGEQALAVRDAVEALPDQTRLALVLCYACGFTYEQIAEVMHLNRNHVATLIFRGKRALRKKLGRHGREQEG